MPLGQLGLGQRLEPGQPAQFVLGEDDGLILVVVNDDRITHGHELLTRLGGGLALPERGTERAQADDGANLKRQERDEL